MDIFDTFLNGIDSEKIRNKTKDVLGWVEKTFPKLEKAVKWNQPMFIDHGTFIIGFSASKKHLAIAPEIRSVEHFSNDILKAGYNQTKMLIQIPWDQEVDYKLLEKIIKHNIEEKKNVETFWW
ncbi:iron chaperone [Peloplasma aerotolerans]|uniref:DUF1801 domain-containing protein n=1 Tax=Peloplasma aerotolerans TaxID=3044389 RepID=A0AAW6UDP2_9MOLU|nr:DUF1801 domain-containing protein [Mariniplasma sp. M4Ah]MDI6453759.1 DUF1801 domain-containing protein [Mariniplasma sp. M4Ah]